MVYPKKHLGQHFLKDDNIARKIVDTLLPATENLLEIGAGTGILTKHILTKQVSNFYIIEIDRESVEYLNKNFTELNGKVILADFLKFDLSGLFDGHFSIVGNFPYNISGPILFKVLEYRNSIVEVVGMFQKEVAERIASPPGSKKYGILSVLIKAFFEIEYLFTVNESVFYPPPKVKSAVIRLKRNNIKKLNCDENIFIAMIKAGFNQRRKTLRNSLKSFNLGKNEKVENMLKLRAEQLTVEDFEYLARQVNHNNN